LISIGPITIYWYGVFIVLGILLAILTAIKLAGIYKISKDTIIDLAFWLVIAGVIGARLYDVMLSWKYYQLYPGDIIKVWQGGLAIHGAIFGGALALWIYVKKYKLDLWNLAAVIVPGLALAQAVGRWGNYFNQELFGRPTGLPWGIPIEPANRLTDYFNYAYFHPVFLYESIGSLFIFGVLMGLHYFMKKQDSFRPRIILGTYLVLYSFLRFTIEFWRIDPTPIILGLRAPQAVSLGLTIAVGGYALYLQKKVHLKKSKVDAIIK
jgi:phosphatidylglycerol:prolipoprotein diacylglycerol transferase